MLNYIPRISYNFEIYLSPLLYIQNEDRQRKSEQLKIKSKLYVAYIGSRHGQKEHEQRKSIDKKANLPAQDEKKTELTFKDLLSKDQF